MRNAKPGLNYSLNVNCFWSGVCSQYVGDQDETLNLLDTPDPKNILVPSPEKRDGEVPAEPVRVPVSCGNILDAIFVLGLFISYNCCRVGGWRRSILYS